MKKKPMDFDEARKEAVRRWGYQARAEHSAMTGFAHMVSSRYSNHWGRGNSWEEAFADADRRDKEK